MKLLLTIVQDADAARLQETLAAQGLQSTKLASTGGFLREGNTTLLIGVEAAEVERVKAIVGETCRERTKVMSATSPIHALEGVFTSPPLEVPVGGAIVFVLSVDEFLRL
ncbi:MAG TPA: cyclic-di-AMP receptor [Trueperaceae bacterium]|nr:cyclic-di-AMP receptor [Trueperaceae bacterium]